jgi:dTDP-4-dehydrorhamnose reductase
MLVVTGASGLLGATLLRSAVEQGMETIGLCHEHLIRSPKFRTVRIDLTDKLATRKLLSDLRPSSIVHCAAATNVDWCEDNPKQAEAINARASGYLAESAAELNSRLFYISTDAVFDGKKGDYVETDEVSPLNVYARSKLAGERETLRRNPGSAIVRVNIYGWNAQNKHSLAEWVLKSLEEGKSISGFTDVLFTPILVNDLVSVLLELLRRDLTGVYHVAGSEKISKFDFARRVADTFGFDPGLISPCQVKDLKLKAVRPLDISLDTGKIVAEMNRPMPNIEEGLVAFRKLREQHFPELLKSYLGDAFQS